MLEKDLPPAYLEVISLLTKGDSSINHLGTKNYTQAQKKELLSMYDRFRSSEDFFAKSYTQLTVIEKTVASCQSNWQN